MDDIIADLRWRGLVHQTTDEEGIARWMVEQPRTLYAGFDPTADSLHVGSLLPLVTLRRFQKAGHKPIALVGGATGMIGDPSGKSEERNLLDVEALRRNVEGIASQMKRFLTFEGDMAAVLVNNFDWMSKFSYLEFLRDVGKNFPVNVMLAKDSVKNRLESEAGISYTEFSYMLLQAYDFVHLHTAHGCQLQIGGSDQWGNITAGIDLARRMKSVQLHGLTMPLLLTSDGRKMGKTEQGTIWLSAERTSPFQFYQYWYNIADADAGRCLRMLTELSHAEIEELDAARQANPQQRDSQKRLAEELTRLIHGEAELQEVLASTHKAFSGGMASQGAGELAAMMQSLPSKVLPQATLDQPFLITDAMTLVELCKSKGEVRRKVTEKGVYVNDEVWLDATAPITAANLLHNQFLVLRLGKKQQAILRFEA
jgi:tyrosyl-tRNA synthetase